MAFFTASTLIPRGMPSRSCSSPGLHKPELRRSVPCAPITLRCTFLGQDDFFPSSRGGKDHALHCGGRPVPPSERRGHALKGLRRQIFRFPDHRNRVAEIVQWLHGIHIQLGCSSPPEAGSALDFLLPLLWPGTSKGDHSAYLSKTFQQLS